MIQWQLTGNSNEQWYIEGQRGGGDEIYNAASGLVLGDPGYSPYDGTPIVQWQNTNSLNERWRLDNVGNGNYAIYNEASGKVLGDPQSSTNNGTGLIQWQWNDSFNEQWTLVPAGNAAPVTYYVANGASGKVLDNAVSTSEGTGVIQWQLNGGTNQQWTFVQIANGNYLIVNAQSGLVLDNPSGSTLGGGIDQWQLNGGTNQQWQISQSFISSTILNCRIVNAASGLMLADPNSDTSNGTVVIQYQPGGTEQQWALLPAGNAPAQTYYVGNADLTYADNGNVQVLADPSGSTQSGTNLIMWPPLNTVEQQWTFVQLADGDYLMVNGASGDVVDGSGGTLYGEGSPIYQSQLTGSLGQQWQLVGLPPGPAPGNELLPPGANFYNLINASSGFALDQPLYPIVGPDPFNGSGVDSWPTNGGENQIWILFSGPITGPIGPMTAVSH